MLAVQYCTTIVEIVDSGISIMDIIVSNHQTNSGESRPAMPESVWDNSEKLQSIRPVGFGPRRVQVGRAGCAAATRCEPLLGAGSESTPIGESLLGDYTRMMAHHQDYMTCSIKLNLGLLYNAAYRKNLYSILFTFLVLASKLDSASCKAITYMGGQAR